MKITKILYTKSFTGFYFDDQQAIKAGAAHDGLLYIGQSLTPGFKRIRQSGEAVSIQLVLADGSVAYGDCAAVQYSGAGGRDPLFIAEEAIKFLEEKITPLLINEDVSTFKTLAEKYDKLIIDGKKLHTALRYGITQALLDATAKAHKLTRAEIIRKEYKISGDVYHKIPVFAQSGDDRYLNADKMILKEVEVLPHALINNVKEKLGLKGELLLDYLKWLKNRIEAIRVHQEYTPIIHIDTYGTIGLAFNYDVEAMLNYMATLAQAAKPFKLRIEGPVDAGNQEDTLKYLSILTKKLDERSIDVEIVADEWCNTLEDIKLFADHRGGHMIQVKTPDLGGVNNTVEALLYCKEKGVGAYCGGTCNETNISCECSVNIAIATKADQQLAKPGMGVDEAIMIVKNEINRVVSLANSRK